MNKPRVYIAAPWTYKDSMPAVGKQFKQAGFKITHKWWEHDTISGYLQADISDTDLIKCIEQAQHDAEGVVFADVFVLINESKSEGKAVETGIALEAGLPIILVGPKTNIFHYMTSVKQVGSVKEAIEEAKKYVDVIGVTELENSIGEGSLFDDI